MMSSRETVEAEDESEELDPRVQEELEKLNSCTDEINRSILPSLILLYPNNQYLGKGSKKKSGNFPTWVQEPPPLPKVGKIFFLFDIWCLKSIFVQRNFFSIFLWLVPLVLGVGAPKIRDPSLNLGVGTPNIGDPSPSAPKIRDPSLNLGVGANIGKVGKG